MPPEAIKEHQERLKAIKGMLDDAVICDRCGATINTFADVCTARLDDPCPGFLAIEEARQKVRNAPV